MMECLILVPLVNISRISKRAADHVGEATQRALSRATDRTNSASHCWRMENGIRKVLSGKD